MGTTTLSQRGTDLDKLSDKMRMFVAEYPVDFNAQRAAIDAGYSKKTANVKGCQLLKDPRIQRALGKAQRLRIERLELDADELMRQIQMLGTRDGRQLFDKKGIMVLNHQVIDGVVQGTTIHDLPEQITAAMDGVEQEVERTIHEDGTIVEVVKTKLKLVGKQGILDMAAKVLGAYAPEKRVIAAVAAPNWSDLIGSEEPPDRVEQRIIDVESKPVKRKGAKR